MSHSSNADADSLCGWVCKSTRRLKAMAVLLRQPNTVKGIATRTNLHKSHLSSALSKLVDKGLVESKSLGRKKLFSLTEKGYNIAKSTPVLNLYFHKGLVSNVKSVLNELSIPYARNVKLKANNNKDVAEFVILDGFEPKMAVAVRNLPYDTYGALKDGAFWLNTWKSETEGLKTALVLGGRSKESILEGEGKFFLEADFLDVVIHEEDLECARKKELDLEDFLKIEKYCVDWSTGN